MSSVHLKEPRTRLGGGKWKSSVQPPQRANSPGTPEGEEQSFAEVRVGRGGSGCKGNGLVWDYQGTG
jgi:hypothetical protein